MQLPASFSTAVASAGPAAAGVAGVVSAPHDLGVPGRAAVPDLAAGSPDAGGCGGSPVALPALAAVPADVSSPHAPASA